MPWIDSWLGRLKRRTVVRPADARPDHGWAAQDTLPPATIIGRYRVLRVLGRGAFGVTYLVSDETLGGQLAIKEYLPDAVASRSADLHVRALSPSRQEEFEQGLQRFLQEARTLRQLSTPAGHPAIVAVRDYVEAFGTAYTVMDYCIGEDLEAILRRRKYLDEGSLVQLVGPLLEGLEHVHAAGIIHRDIKPSNILVRPDGSPVLLDFGAARQTVHAPSQGVTVVLTPGYAPIEQYSGWSQLGPWTDIYAMGATLYQAISGQPPPMSVSRLPVDPLVPASVAGKGRYTPGFLNAVDAALAVPMEQRPQDVRAWRRMLGLTSGEEPCPVHPRGRETPLSEFITHQADLYQDRKLEDLLRCVRTARAIHGDDPELWNHEGIALSDMGRYREALDCFERSIELRPGWVRSWCNKGRALRALRRPDEALVCYDKAIACGPSEIIPYVNKGNCLLEDLGRKEDAAECYRRAADLRPWNQADRVSLDHALRTLKGISA
jgi:serine/threonine protein kinase